MEKPVVTLTQKYREATVKKGDSFQVELTEGGVSGLKWDIAFYILLLDFMRY